MRRRWGGAKNEGIFDSEHAERWGVWLPASSIGSIAHSFLDGLAAVHGAHAPVLRRQLAKDGGYAMHVDGTCEVDTEVLFTALAEPRGWTLEVAKMTGENTEEIKKSVVPSSPIPQRLEDLPEHSLKNKSVSPTYWKLSNKLCSQLWEKRTNRPPPHERYVHITVILVQ